MSTAESTTRYPELRKQTYSLTLRLDVVPRCPVCGEKLCSQVTRVRASVAICDRCYDVHPVTFRNYLAALLLPELSASQRLVAGVIFWTPSQPNWTSVEYVLRALGYNTCLLTDPPSNSNHSECPCSNHHDLHQYSMFFLPFKFLPAGRVSPRPSPISSPNASCNRTDATALPLVNTFEGRHD